MSVALRAQRGPYFANGQLQAGAKLYHFESGLGEVDRDIWDDRTKVLPLTQPIVADQNGIFNFFGDGLYKIIICKPDSTGPSDQVLYILDNWSMQDPSETTFSIGESLPSASTVGLGLDVVFHVLGNTTIEAFSGDLPFFWAIFDGTPELVHSANLLLPGSRNRQMLANDVGFFIHEGGSIYRLGGHQEVEGNYVSRQGSATASSATIAVPTDGDFIDMSGSADISAISTAAAGFRFTIRFTAAGAQFIHNATSLLCPWGRDYRVFADELIECRSLGGGNWIIASLNGPHITPGALQPLFDTAADDGYILPVGTALVCSDYRALAKRCIPHAATLGTSGTSLGTTTFVNGTDIWTLNSHGLVVGDLVQLTNSGGALPTGYAAATLYHVVAVTTNTYQLSLTRGGAVVDGTTNGTGTHTVHDKFQIPDVRGCPLAALDNLGGAAASRVTSASTNGANASVLGGRFGAQTHTLTGSEVPSHAHVQQYDSSANTAAPGSNIAGFATAGPVLATAAQSTAASGTNGVHSNTQPTMAMGVQMRT